MYAVLWDHGRHLYAVALLFSMSLLVEQFTLFCSLKELAGSVVNKPTTGRSVHNSATGRDEQAGGVHNPFVKQYQIER